MWNSIVDVPRFWTRVMRGPAASPLKSYPRELATSQQKSGGVLLTDRGQQVVVWAHFVEDRVCILVILRAAHVAQYGHALLRFHFHTMKCLTTTEQIPRKTILLNDRLPEYVHVSVVARDRVRHRLCREPCVGDEVPVRFCWASLEHMIV